MNKPAKEAINTYLVDDVIKAGMLSSPQIAYCQEHYKIIDNYAESCLKSATYDMRLGGPAVTWKDGEKFEFTLSDVNDENKKIRSSIVLQPNSVSYVTTIEGFNLPKDIIARFNLKSKWVHKGLLLGTGPIVDPEFNANLLIPLHNFSSNPIEIKYNQKFISVEFTKTLNPEDDNPALKNYEYHKNSSRSFDLIEYMETGGTPHSSVASVFVKNEKIIKQNADLLDKIKDEYQKSKFRYSIIGGATIAGTVIGLVVLVVTTWMLLSSTFDQLNDAKNLIKQYQATNIDYSAFVLKNDYDKLKKQFEQLKKYTEQVNTKATLDISHRAEDIKIINDCVEKNIKITDSKIDSLNKEITKLKKNNEKN